VSGQALTLPPMKAGLTLPCLRGSGDKGRKNSHFLSLASPFHSITSSLLTASLVPLPTLCIPWHYLGVMDERSDERNEGGDRLLAFSFLSFSFSFHRFILVKLSWSTDGMRRKASLFTFIRSSSFPGDKR